MANYIKYIETGMKEQLKKLLKRETTLEMPNKFAEMTTTELLEIKGGNYNPKEFGYATYKGIVSLRGVKSLSAEQLLGFFNDIMSKLNVSKDDAESYQEAEDLYQIVSTEILTRYKVLNVG